MGVDDLPTPEIKAYRCGHIVIGGQAHGKDAIILPERVKRT
ncbi:MAG: hypothetical protein SWK90_06880 [Chloroflexota bacterium]|nr:hypothetical protein [Chloroflexota bacterium]